MTRWTRIGEASYPLWLVLAAIVAGCVVAGRLVLAVEVAASWGQAG